MDSTIRVIPSDNPANYCRLCFSEKNLVALFPGDNGSEHLLVEQISLLIGIQIGPAKDSSSSICWRCAVALEDFQLLRQRSLDHDAIIRKNRKGNPIVAIKEEPLDSEQLMINSATIDLHSKEAAATPSINSNDNSVELQDSGHANQHDSNGKTRKLTCNFCKKIFGTPTALAKHFKEQHSDNGRPFHCPLCPSQFKRKDHLGRHMTMHTGIKKYACKDCGAKYTKAIFLSRHMSIFHGNSDLVKKPKKPSPTGNYSCRFCPKSFRHRPSLNTHVKSHYDILPYFCDICDARFAVPQGLSVHRGKYHAVDAIEKPDMARYKCDHCPRFFKYRRSLQEHTETEHMICSSNNEGDADENESESEPELPDPDGMEYIQEEILPIEFKTEIEDAQLQE